MITPFLLVSVLFAQEELPTVGANSRQQFAFEWSGECRPAGPVCLRSLGPARHERGGELLGVLGPTALDSARH